MSETIISTNESGDQLLPSVIEDDNFLAVAAKRVDNFDRIKKLAISITNENDWVDQNGKPYMTASAAEKIARLFGISTEKPSYRKEYSEDDKGRFYFYIMEGKVKTKHGDEMNCIGTCSSRDKFFSVAKGETKALSEIDETNLLKAAYSNFIVNGISRILGLRNMTWDEVLAFAKFKKENVAKVKYESQEVKDSKDDENRVKLHDILTETSLGDNAKYKDTLRRLTEFTNKQTGKLVAGVEDLSSLHGIRLQVTRQKAEKSYETWKKNRQSQPVDNQEESNG